MQVSDLIGQACVKARMADTTATVPTNIYTWALGALNRIYSDVWNSYPARDEKMFLVTVSVTAGATEVVLPAEMEAIRAIHDADEAIFPINEIHIANFVPEEFGETGDSYNYINLTDTPVTAQPTAGAKIKLVSSSTADTTAFYTRIVGTVSGATAHEDLALNGTTAVTSANTYTDVRAITKPLTTGRITISNATSSATIGTIAPWEYQAKYRRIRLIPAPEDATTIYVHGVRSCPRLVSQYDSILLGRMESAIFDYLVAELYELDDKAEKAAVERAKAQERKTLALAREEVTDISDRRSFPGYGMFGDSGSTYRDLSPTGINTTP